MVLPGGVALAVGNRIILAHLMGAKQYDSINRRMHKSLFISTMGSFFFAGLIYLLATPLFKVFTNNSDIIALGTTLLLIGIVSDPIRCAGFVVGGALKGCGDVKVAPYLGVVSMVFVFLPLVYILGIRLEFGLIGIWFASLIDEITRCSINYLRWRTRKWEKLGVTRNLPDIKAA